MDKTIQHTLSGLTQLLVTKNIRHALVGGLAASIRGRVRVTEVVDLVLDCSVDDAIALLRSLDPNVFGPFFPSAEEVVRQCFILPLEDKRSKIKADLAIGISGFEKMVVDRATAVEIAGELVQVATVEELVLIKIIAGRPQDDQDIKGLLAASRSILDWDYCIGVATQLQEALGMDLVAKILTLKND